MASDYCTVAQVREYVGLLSLETGDDEQIAQEIRRASREIERHCHRHFYPLTESRYYDYPDDLWSLPLHADLLSCTTLTIDGTAIASDNYKLYPKHTDVKHRIDIKRGTGDRFGWSETWQDCILIAGVWGWHDDYDNCYESSGQTISGNLATGTTRITVANASDLSPRMTVKIDNELMMVTAVQATTFDVQRAINGTTAATHASGATVYIYRPPLDVEKACIRLIAWYYRQSDAPFEKTATPALGTVTIPEGMPADITKRLSRLVKVELR